MNDKEANELIGGLAIMAMIGIVLVSVIAVFASNSGSDTPEGVTGNDLARAVLECTPTLATFEQKLACYQAVYGNVPIK